MKAWKNLSNQMLKDVSELVTCIQKKVDKVEGLAQAIEYRDKADANSCGF
ncbi:hypothetical protein [Lactococcus lactis]|nr:hypothetical protein [Lactococcus lactis]MDT2888075.1 hypothetical protein [Lactococcus lactis]MDT2930898.1 hypothetical protein [Lactococcus lactis]